MQSEMIVYVKQANLGKKTEIDGIGKGKSRKFTKKGGVKL